MNKRESILNRWHLNRALNNGFITPEELEEIFNRIALKYPDNLKSSSLIEMFVNFNVKKEKLNISITNNFTKEEMQYYSNNYKKTWTYIKEKEKITYMEVVRDRIEDSIEGKKNKITAKLENPDETETIIEIKISVPVTINEAFYFINQIKNNPITGKIKTGDRIYEEIEVKKLVSSSD